MKFIKNLPWGAITAFIIVPVIGICLICWHTAWEHDYFGDGSCHVCQTGHYELFDKEDEDGERFFYIYNWNIYVKLFV